MSGIFRYNSNVSSHKKTLSPFCTSPGQLQDVTSDTHSLGFRSFGQPSGTVTPPGQRLSIREYDKQLTVLRNENFNLKLRIYFLEEKNSGGAATNNADGTDSLFKQNIDLKVETEALRKELQEKQELLCQAAKAMELMEESQKNSEDKSQATIEDLTQKIQFLELEIHALEKSSQNDETNCNDFIKNTQQKVDEQQRIAELEEYVKDHELKSVQQSNKIKECETLIMERDHTIKELENKMDQMTYEISEYKEKHIENNENQIKNECATIKAQLYEHKKELAEKTCLLTEVESQLEEKTALVNKGCTTIHVMMRKIKDLETELNHLKNRERKTNEISNDSLEVSMQKEDLIKKLKSDLKYSLLETQQANVWRQECADVCGLLTNRLQELAEFLDSLLKHKDILGFLAQDRRKAMRKAVDKSLDLSRSLHNMSVSNSGRLSFNDQSHLELSHILFTSYDDNHFTENKENLSFNNKEIIEKSDDLNKSVIIKNLKAEITTLKVKLENSNHVIMETKNENVCPLDEIKNEKKYPLVDSNSESEAWSEPDRIVSTARIGIDVIPSKLTTITKRSPNSKYNIDHHNNDAITSNSSTASDNELNKLTKRNHSTIKLIDKISELELIISERENEILKAQCSLVESDNRRTEDKLKIVNLTKEIENLQKLYDVLKINEIELNATIKNYGDIEKQLQILQLSVKEKTLTEDELKRKLDESNVDLRVSTMKLNALQNDFTELKEKYQQQLDEQIAYGKQQFEIVKMEIINKYEKELMEKDDQIDILKNYEKELNSQFIENEKTIRILRKNLDDSILQASKVILERTKILTEKSQLENLVSQLQDKLNEILIEKSELNSKIAQLENSNAKLQHTLIVSDSQYQLSKSASLGNVKYLQQQQQKRQLLNEQQQQQQQCGYTTDEIKHLLGNSSPDLGIESDAGRTSSGDNKINVNRFLNTEVQAIKYLHKDDTENHDILSEKENVSKSINLQNTQKIHDCEKIERENIDLKRKLKRTHRALENTWSQLRTSNHRKEQIEKDILQEIYKTHNVLKNVRTNMENVKPNQQSTQEESGGDDEENNNGTAAAYSANINS